MYSVGFIAFGESKFNLKTYYSLEPSVSGNALYTDYDKVRFEILLESYHRAMNFHV